MVRLTLAEAHVMCAAGWLRSEPLVPGFADRK